MAMLTYAGGIATRGIFVVVVTLGRCLLLVKRCLTGSDACGMEWICKMVEGFGNLVVRF